MESNKDKVLVVDDVEVNLIILEEIIKNMGLEAVTATSVKEAFNYMQNGLPQVILSDISMPDIDGYTFCNMLKKDPYTREIPVIFISAMDSASDLSQGFANGAVDYITKPFDKTEVEMRITTHLKLYNLQKDLEDNNRRLSTIVTRQLEKLRMEQRNVMLALAKLIENRESMQMPKRKDCHYENINYNSRILAQGLQLSPHFENDITDEFIETIKELWDLLVHKIPRNENDYFKIKENYEKLMNKLNSKIVNKTNLINELTHDIKKLKEDWKKSVTPDAIDLIYNQELEELNLKLNTAIEEEKRISRSVERAKETLFDDPFYLEEFKNRVYNLQIEIIGMKREYQLIQNAGPRFANKKYGNSKITYAERKAQIERKLKIFPDIKAVEKYVRRELINEDRFYQARVNDLEKISKVIIENDIYVNDRIKQCKIWNVKMNDAELFNVLDTSLGVKNE